MAFSLAFLATIAAARAAEPEERPPTRTYPSRRRPPFRLGVALVRGDTKTAPSLYIGDQKDFANLVEALAEAVAAAESFLRAASAQYGKNAATLTVGPAGIEPKLALKAGGPQMPLTSLVAAVELKRKGNEATLLLGGDLEIRLKREKREWKVVYWPPLPREATVFANVLAAAYKELAGDIQRGQYRKAYEMYPALGGSPEGAVEGARRRSREVTAEISGVADCGGMQQLSPSSQSGRRSEVASHSTGRRRVSNWWWIAGLAAYLLVGGLFLLRQSAHHPDFAPAPDWTGVVLLLAWPLALTGWALFRGPEPPSGRAQARGPMGDRLPPAGKAVSDLCPRGTVEVAGRQHPATAEGRPVRAGEEVEIIGRVGRVLRVRGCPAETDSVANQASR